MAATPLSARTATTSPIVFKGQVQSPAIAALPSDPMAGKRVLDVGCGTGKDLTHSVYANSQRYGIDPDAESIAYGRQHYPGISLTPGIAESLPYSAQSFDFVISRVALLYADIPVALAEVARVLRPGGEFVVTLHDYRAQLKYTFTTIVRVVDFLIYVLPVSLLACAFRHTPKRFWNGRRETFQLGWCFARQLRKAGFHGIRTERVRGQWVFRARRMDLEAAYTERYSGAVWDLRKESLLAASGQYEIQSVSAQNETSEPRRADGAVDTTVRADEESIGSQSSTRSMVGFRSDGTAR